MHRIDKNGSLTRGEAREYILEYVDQKFAEIFVNPKMLGWDKAGLLTKVQGMEDYNTLLVTEKVGSRDWQWTEHEMSEAQQRALSNPITQMLQLPNTWELIRTNRMNEQQARALGEERLGVLISPGGKKLLEGENPRLTIAQALALNVGQITAMKSSQELVFSDVRQLIKPQAKGIILGLSLEQVRIENYGEHTLEAINILRENESPLPLNEAYQRVAGLDRAQVEERVPGVAQANVRNAGQNDIARAIMFNTVQVNAMLSIFSAEQHAGMLTTSPGISQVTSGMANIANRLFSSSMVNGAIRLAETIGRSFGLPNNLPSVNSYQEGELSTTISSLVEGLSQEQRMAMFMEGVNRLAIPLRGVSPIPAEQASTAPSSVIGGNSVSRQHHFSQNHERS